MLRNFATEHPPSYLSESSWLGANNDESNVCLKIVVLSIPSICVIATPAYQGDSLNMYHVFVKFCKPHLGILDIC